MGRKRLRQVQELGSCKSVVPRTFKQQGVRSAVSRSGNVLQERGKIVQERAKSVANPGMHKSG